MVLQSVVGAHKNPLSGGILNAWAVSFSPSMLRRFKNKSDPSASLFLYFFTPSFIGFSLSTCLMCTLVHCLFILWPLHCLHNCIVSYIPWLFCCLSLLYIAYVQLRSHWLAGIWSNALSFSHSQCDFRIHSHIAYCRNDYDFIKAVLFFFSFFV